MRVLIIILIYFSSNSFSQDIIVKYNQDSIYCNIIDVNPKTIKYDSTKYSNKTIFEINRKDVLKIIFENKEELSIYNDSSSIDIYTNFKKNALTFYLLSPFVGHIGIGYERYITHKASFDYGMSFIYGRYQYQRTEVGGTARLGYKFIKRKDYSKEQVRFTHITKGTYFKPELVFSAFNSSYNFTNNDGIIETHSDDVFSVVLIINYGVQYVYDNAFLMDFYFGLGGGFSSSEADFYYSNVSIKSDPHDFCFSITMGVKIGGLF